MSDDTTSTPRTTESATESTTERATAPAVNPVRWSGNKTAVAAALALGLSSMGALAAAAAHEAGSATTQDGRRGFPGPPSF